MLSLSFGYRIGHSTCSAILRETCKAFSIVLAPDYLSVPTHSQWLKISEDFYKQWDFPNCIGAIDGKHIRIQAPAKSGSDFFNYKGFFSIVLMAMCDAYYRFTIIDVGALGREGDKGIFSSSLFNQQLLSNKLSIPDPMKLPLSETVVPYVIVGDEAFSIEEQLDAPLSGCKDWNSFN